MGLNPAIVWRSQAVAVANRQEVDGWRQMAAAAGWNHTVSTQAFLGD